MNKEIEEEIFSVTEWLTRKYKFKENDINRLKRILIKIAHNYYGDRLYSKKNIDKIKLSSGAWFEPNIHSYFSQAPHNKVFELFENNDINDLIALEYYLDDLDFEFFFTYEELNDILKAFIKYLLNNQNAIINTGFPLKSFELSNWFFNNLSNLYPIKEPFAILRKEKDKEGNFLLEYHWIKTPGNSLNSCDLKKDDYLYAPYCTAIYSFSTIDLIENKRPILFEIKLDIFNILSEALLSKNCVGLWEKCFKSIADKLELQDFNHLIRIGEIDYLYAEDNGNILKPYNILNPHTHFREGGLSQLIELIFQVEKELRLGTINKIKNKIISLSKKNTFSTYYDLLINIDFSELIDIGFDFHEYQKDEEKYRNFFRKRLSHDLKKSFNPSLSDKPNRSESNETIINSIMNKINSKTYFTEPKDVYKTNIHNIIPIKLPPGTKWGQIVIQFIDNESVEISGPKKFREVRSFREMGFENRKKLGRPPNKLWVFLWALAKVKGTFSWDLLDERMRNSEIIKDAMNTATKRKQLVMQKLKKLFNLEEDPIIYDRKTKIYQTQFRIMLQHESD